MAEQQPGAAIFPKMPSNDSNTTVLALEFLKLPETNSKYIDGKSNYLNVRRT